MTQDPYGAQRVVFTPSDPFAVDVTTPSGVKELYGDVLTEEDKKNHAFMHLLKEGLVDPADMPVGHNFGRATVGQDWGRWADRPFTEQLSSVLPFFGDPEEEDLREAIEIMARQQDGM